MAAAIAARVSAVGPSKETKTSAFVDALNRRRRGRKPLARSHARKAPGPSYAAAARLQPKMWTAGLAQEARRKIVRKRSSREMGKSAGHREANLEEAPAAGGSPAKKPRRVSPPPSRPSSSSPSFLRSDLLRRRYGGLSPLLKASKAVTFANPLVTDSWTRPRTRRADVERLFYSRADEARFRKELHRERRLRLLQADETESDDEDSCRAAEEKAKASFTIVIAAKCDEMEEDPNEVTESDDSSESDEDSGSSSDEEHDRYSI